MTKRSEVKRVKSAQRVLEVLEYFTAERQHATVMDIARSMGYPQSSTSELLSCLVSLGYLLTDRRARVYWPSARVALLGAWVSPILFRQGTLLPMMDRLAQQTGAAVVLTSKVDIWAQCLHSVAHGLHSVAHGLHSVAHAGHHETPQVGARELLTKSAAGRLLLSTLEPDHMRKLIHRINAEITPETRLPLDRLLADIHAVSQRKIAGGRDAEGSGVIAMLLPQAAGAEPLTIGLHCATDDLAKNAGEYIRLLKNTLSDKTGWEKHSGHLNIGRVEAAVLAA
jgi:DNA-binding IclR family transcriptional regulator